MSFSSELLTSALRPRSSWRRAGLGLLAFAAVSSGAAGVWAQGENKRVGPDGGFLSPEMVEVDVQEHLGDTLDPELRFVDHLGQSKTLGDYFDGETPIMVTLNYYRCPGICNVQLNAVTETFRKMKWTAGDGNFRVLTFSIDPRESWELARDKRSNILEDLGRGKEVDWTFFTGDALNIQLLAAQLGVGYAYDKQKDQYAHPPVVMFVSPNGKIARYVYGLSYAPSDVKFALMEASEGRVGSTVDRLILSCFHYDATAGKYGPFAFGIMRLAGAVTVVLVGGLLALAWRRERHKRMIATEALS